MSENVMPHVVIVGGGFGGLSLALGLRKAPVRVTLIDRRNFHLFQPLLYQVATGGLSPGDIASPLRSVLKSFKRMRVVQAEVMDIDPRRGIVTAGQEEIAYDQLVVASGVRHHYFGHDEWSPRAPGLKTIEDALEIRKRVLRAFEIAELEGDPQKRRALMRFVIVGGGPTGVELAGALGELANKTLKHDFRHIDPTATEIILVEGTASVLPSFPATLQKRAHRSLERLGVAIRTNTMVTGLDDHIVTLKKGQGEDQIHAQTVLWAAGVKATRLGRILADRCAVETDSAGKLKVNPDFSVPGFSNLFVIGDLAHALQASGQPIPGVAPAAMQQGRYLARAIRRRLAGKPARPFKYRNKGNLAVIGRNAAVADFGFLRLSGAPAWFLWAMVHIHFLIEFDNKMMVGVQWAWSYLTRKAGARLITK